MPDTNEKLDPEISQEGFSAWQAISSRGTRLWYRKKPHKLLQEDVIPTPTTIFIRLCLLFRSGRQAFDLANQ